MEFKKLSDFKKELATLTEVELRNLLEDTKANMSDMEAQLAEQNALIEAGDEDDDESLEWRARCLTALKWERRRYSLVKRTLAKAQKEDATMLYLRRACAILQKVFSKEVISLDDKNNFHEMNNFLKKIDLSKSKDISTEELSSFSLRFEEIEEEMSLAESEA